jgi:hypothetical protein
MAIIRRHHSEMDALLQMLRFRGLPHQGAKALRGFNPAADTIKVWTTCTPARGWSFRWSRWWRGQPAVAFRSEKGRSKAVLCGLPFTQRLDGVEWGMAVFDGFLA